MKKEMEKRNITLEGIQPFDGDPTFVIENLQVFGEERTYL